MEISDAVLLSCPDCGGMVVLVHETDSLAIWCTECEHTWDTRRTWEYGGMSESAVIEWWNENWPHR